MGANTTTVSQDGTTINIALNATHDTDWVWTDEYGTNTWAIIHSIQVNPAASDCDIVINDGGADATPIFTQNMTDTDDNRIKYYPKKKCQPYIDADDCTNAGSATIQIELY